MRRLTASQIVSLFLYKDRDILYGSFPSGYAMAEGKRIHDRLGYNQPWLFRRFFFTGKDWWIILGCPDKLDEKNGVILELKTFGQRNISPNAILVARIQCQLYCYLTGIDKFAIYGHSVYSNRTSKRLEGKYDAELTEKIIRTAIELRESLAKFAKEYRENKEKVLKGLEIKPS